MLLTVKRFWTVVVCGFCYFITPLASSAQVYQINLEWQNEIKSISTIDGNTILVPTFKNATHLETVGLLPHYVSDYRLNSKGILSAEISGAVYSAVTGINPTSALFVSDNIQPSVTLSIEKKIPYAHLEILPFRKNASTGQIEKLVSFTIRITNKQTPQPRDSRSNYASSSVLSSGNWYKVAVTTNGIFKIDFNFVKTKLGIDPGSFAFNKLAVFGNGGGMVPDANSVLRADDLLENPTFINDNNGNNRFDDGDYILFYAEGADKWRFNATTSAFYHEKNLYSDKNYYFITTTNGTGKRAVQTSFSGPASNTFTEFNDFAFHESDEENILQSGKDWLGDKMTNFNNTKTFSFNFPNIINSSAATFFSRVGAKTTYGSVTTANANGQTVTHAETGIPQGSYPPAYKQLEASVNFNPTSSQISVTYNFSATTDPTGTAAAYIDFFELHVKRSLTLTGNWMAFRNSASVGVGNNSEFSIGNMAQGYRVWDVSNPGTIKELSGSFSGSNFSFISPTSEIKEFVAFNPSGSFSEPEFVEKTPNQDLHAIGEPDMIIVTPSDFKAAAEKLADFHRTADGISVGVVEVHQIYNEFGSGRKDISAIRDFMKMLYDRAGSDTALMPRYLLLFGDGSFDPKNRVAGNQEFIPAYESYQSIDQIGTYTSDDFFVLLDDNEGGNISVASQKLDAAVGRIPVGSATEAMDVVNKIILYKSRGSQALNCNTVNNNGSWKNMITFIADDCDDGGNAFVNASDQLSETVRTQYPAYNIDKIYLDAFKQLSTPAGPRYPDVNTAILNRINSGTLILNWVGHGGETNWASERVFNKPDIIVLENKEKLPLFVTATCDFSRFDIPDRTAGEWLVVNKNGGSIASITTVRLVYSSANDALNGELFKHIFELYEGRLPTIGELLTRTKNLVQTDITNSRKFVLLGDPALTLNYPRYDVVTTMVNNVPIAQPHDTLKALSKITIKGEVRDDNGAKMQNFNGVVYPVVYDKMITLKTLNNEGKCTTSRNFSLYKSILFKGKASVTAGDFSFTFIVPKDMNYQYGNGRVSYYADNNANMDAHGYSNSIVIGGSADSFAVDNGGPEVKIYMNDENFVFGGTTNESPLLLVKMKDESGINTSGNGIGHDLTAVLDENTQNMVILNDYYESELDDYQKGNIRYPYRKLTEGRHTLRMKAWDIHNNSSEEHTEFVVASSAKLALSHVYNYPNPFTTRTQFMFEHNKPCEDLNVTIQIYTVSGKVVKTLHDEVTCEGYRVNDIEWDGLDDYGQPIGKGVYVYKLNVRASNGESAHKFEKLVLLR